jgi:hypothetical protein
MLHAFLGSVYSTTKVLAPEVCNILVLALECAHTEVPVSGNMRRCAQDYRTDNLDWGEWPRNAIRPT